MSVILCTGATFAKKNSRLVARIVSFYSFVPNTPFLCPLKTTENLTAFGCFFFLGGGGGRGGGGGGRERVHWVHGLTLSI